MLRHTLYAFVVYLFGAIGLLYWSLSGFNAGAPREDWALMIVLPAAWIFSFWPMFGTLVLILRIRATQGLLERIADRLRAEGAANPTDLQALEDLAVRLAARENRLPEFIMRPLVRKMVAQVAAGRIRAQDLSVPQ